MNSSQVRQMASESFADQRKYLHIYGFTIANSRSYHINKIPIITSVPINGIITDESNRINIIKYKQK